MFISNCIENYCHNYNWDKNVNIFDILGNLMQIIQSNTHNIKKHIQKYPLLTKRPTSIKICHSCPYFVRLTIDYRQQESCIFRAPHRPNCNAVDICMENRIPPQWGCPESQHYWGLDDQIFIHIFGYQAHYLVLVFIYCYTLQPHFFHGIIVDQTLICTIYAFTQVSDFSKCFVRRLKIC